jgi:hypothetical protein
MYIFLIFFLFFLDGQVGCVCLLCSLLCAENSPLVSRRFFYSLGAIPALHLAPSLAMKVKLRNPTPIVLPPRQEVPDAWVRRVGAARGKRAPAPFPRLAARPLPVTDALPLAPRVVGWHKGTQKDRSRHWNVEVYGADARLKGVVCDYFSQSVWDITPFHPRRLNNSPSPIIRICQRNLEESC